MITVIHRITPDRMPHVLKVAHILSHDPGVSLPVRFTPSALVLGNDEERARLVLIFQSDACRGFAASLLTTSITLEILHRVASYEGPDVAPEARAVVAREVLAELAALKDPCNLPDSMAKTLADTQHDELVAVARGKEPFVAVYPRRIQRMSGRDIMVYRGAKWIFTLRDKVEPIPAGVINENELPKIFEDVADPAPEVLYKAALAELVDGFSVPLAERLF